MATAVTSSSRALPAPLPDLKERLPEVPRATVQSSPFAIFRLPYDFFLTATAMIKAQTVGDLETRVDAAMRLGAMPLSLVQKVQSFVSFFFRIATILGVNLRHFDLPGSLSVWVFPAAVIGVVLCVIEGIGTTLNFSRIYQLKKRIPPPSFELQSKELRYLYETYFSANKEEIARIKEKVEKKFPQLKKEEDKQAKVDAYTQSLITVKKGNLARRIRPWLVEKIDKQIVPLINDLERGNLIAATKAHEKAKTIFQDMHLQCEKKLLDHTFTILSIVVSFVGFALSFTACPIMIPMMVLLAGTVLATIAYFLEYGFQDQKGWKFSLLPCLPLWMQWVYTQANKKVAL